MLIPTMSKDLAEQLKLAHEVVDVLDRANRRLFVSLLRYSNDKPKNCYAQVRIFARKKEDKKFQQVVFVKYKLEEIIYVLILINSVNDNVIGKKRLCIAP